MSKKKSERLQRLVTIQRQKEKLAENELAAVLSAQRYNDDSVNSVIDALGKFDPIHMVVSGHYSKRLSSLDTKKKKLDFQRGVQEKNMLTERTKANRLEERADAFKVDESREAEEEGLHDLMDILSSHNKSSLR